MAMPALCLLLENTVYRCLSRDMFWSADVWKWEEKRLDENMDCERVKGIGSEIRSAR